MQLKQLSLKNFRCFSDITVDFSHPIILVEGLNGAGKTSILESLYYLCYLRSFRTHMPRELIEHGQQSFFIKALLQEDVSGCNHEIQAGFSGAKRLVKINNKAVCSYRDIFDHYRIVTLTDDDMALIKEGPEVRRAFLDQLLLMFDATYLERSKLIRYVADNRNSLLQGGSLRNQDLYSVLTQQLWAASCDVQKERIRALEDLMLEVRQLLKDYFNDQWAVLFEYKPKLMNCSDTYENFLAKNPSLYNDEQRYGRSLFGAHLDDFSISFEHKKSKNFASRGQQKLIIMLLKIAQVRQIMLKKGQSLFLLDDFMTDFDEKRAQMILSALLSLKTQLIFTAPSRMGTLENSLIELGAQRIILPH